MKADEEVRLPPKTMDVLVYLAERPHQVVAIEEILDTLWPNTITSDHAIHKAISMLRDTFHDDTKHPTYIVTVPKRGYRLVARVQKLTSTDDPEQPFPACRGAQPYIFVSYSHANTELVLPELAWLKEQGVNIWYDESIAPGHEWTEELGEAIEKANQFLFFVTPQSVMSRHCRDELHFALNHNKQVLPVYLAQTDLSKGLELSMGSKQAILKYELPDQAYRDRLLAALDVDVEQSKTLPESAASNKPNNSKLILIAGGIIAIAILAGAFLLYLKPAQKIALVPAAPISETVADLQTDAQSKPDNFDQEPSIAVLPFVNMSSDPEQEYFSDGISEDILNALVKTNTLPVIARTSSFQFKDQNLSVQKIASALNVTHILQGSVRKVTDRVRITAQLVEAATGSHLWSEQYDRQLLDVFAIQDEIATKIVNQIGIALPVGKEIGIDQTSNGTENLEAYELYLQAGHLFNTQNPFEVERAITLFEQALELDPEFADAWFALGAAYIGLGENPFGHRPSEETWPIAINAFRKVLQIDPAHSAAMGFLGIGTMALDYQWREGFRLMEQSIALNDGDAAVLSLYGYALLCIGHPDAMIIMDKAYSLDPYSFNNIMIRATALLIEGRFADANTLMETALIQNRHSYSANIFVAKINADIRKFDIASDYLARARRILGGDHPRIRRVEYEIAKGTGNRALANEIRKDLLSMAEHTRVIDIWPLAEDVNDDQEYIDIIEMTVNQHHIEDWLKIFAAKPPRMPESAWERIQKATRTAEARIHTLSPGWLRSKEDQVQLRSSAISLSEHELDLYIGAFEDPVHKKQVSIVRAGNHLISIGTDGRGRLVPTGDNHFEDFEVNIAYDFVVENGQVTQLKQQRFQVTNTFIRGGEQ